MIFRHSNYKTYLREWMASQSPKGRGEVGKLAVFLNVSPSLVSLVLNSERQFSAEQACELTGYLGLKGIEGEYFVALVSLEKAGSEKLRKFWRQQQKKILQQAEQVSSRVEYEKTLTREQQDQYYGHAVYSQIRVLSTLDGGVSLEDLVSALKLPREQILEALSFLEQSALVREAKARYFASDKVVHVGRESVHYWRHHLNWRVQQLAQATSFAGDDLTYTFPCTLNKADFLKVRKVLLEAVAEAQKIVRASPAEEMACLTVDFQSFFTKRK